MNVRPMRERVADWPSDLSGESVESDEVIERHTRTGRPLGGKAFVERLETVTGQSLAPKRPERVATGTQVRQAARIGLHSDASPPRLSDEQRPTGP